MLPEVSASESLLIDLYYIKQDVLLTAHHNFDCLTKQEYGKVILSLVSPDVSAREGSISR